MIQDQNGHTSDTVNSTELHTIVHMQIKPLYIVTIRKNLRYKGREYM